MHFSALILALVSASTLAAPIDNESSSLPSSSIDNSTSPNSQSALDKRRKHPVGTLSLWQAPGCGITEPAKWAGSPMSLWRECHRFAPQHDYYIRVSALTGGELQVFENEDCTGKLEVKTRLKKWEDKCFAKGENHWKGVLFA